MRAFVNAIQRRPTVAAFSPADVAGLRQWLKADAITGLVNGDQISTWNDSSSNGLNATSSGGTRPTYQSNVLNGQPVVRFDGTDDFLALGDHSALTAGEIFLVFTVNADPPATTARTGLWQFRTVLSGHSSHHPWTDGVVYDSFGTTVRKTVGDPTPSLSSRFRVYNVWSAPSDWAANLDGTSLFTTATNAVNFSSACTLGRSANDTINFYYLHGDIAEMIFYSEKISTGNRALVLSYLQSKYGL